MHRIVLTTCFAAAVAFVAPAAAAAQIWLAPSAAERLRAVSARQVPYLEARQVAYDRGYREGVKRGEQDARRGERFGYHDEREFVRADKGYNRRLGHRERYRELFRDGFAAGYSDGYGRMASAGRDRSRGPYPHGGYGRSGGRYGVPAAYAPPAYENGLRDGYDKGLEDARRNRAYDPVRQAWYRAGDRRYDGRHGPRDEYKQLYRRGFQEGYARGYRAF